MDYLLEAVGKRELFGLLRLEPEKWWHGLLFRDRYNMLGIAASIPQALQDSLSQHPGALTQVEFPIRALMIMPWWWTSTLEPPCKSYCTSSPALSLRFSGPRSRSHSLGRSPDCLALLDHLAQCSRVQQVAVRSLAC